MIDEEVYAYELCTGLLIKREVLLTWIKGRVYNGNS